MSLLVNMVNWILRKMSLSTHAGPRLFPLASEATQFISLLIITLKR